MNDPGEALKESRVREYVRQIRSADEETALVLAFELAEKATVDGMKLVVDNINMRISGYDRLKGLSDEDEA